MSDLSGRQVADVPRERRRLADERDRIAAARDRVADGRDVLAEARERAADAAEAELRSSAGPDRGVLRDLAANSAERTRHQRRRTRHGEAGRRTSAGAGAGDPAEEAWHAERREFLADDRQERADSREALADEGELLADRREERLGALAASAGGGGSRWHSTAGERAHAAAERAAAARARGASARARAEAAQARAALPAARPLADAFLAIAQALDSASHPDGAYAQAVAQAQRLLGATSVSLSLRVGSDVRTAAASSRNAADLDEVQYGSGRGPCLHAITTGDTVASDDLARESRWAVFAAAAAQAGTRSALSVPVPYPSRQPPARGSMNHYGQAPAAFDDETTQIAILLAANLASVLAAADAAGAEIRQLGEAVDTRDVIGQAKGILMERCGLSAEQAFDVLRSASMRLNRKLRDLADELTYTGRLDGTPS